MAHSQHLGGDVRAKLGRWWGRAHGYMGMSGGWIYRNGKGSAVCQGWLALYYRHYYEVWQWINTREVK